MNPPHNQNNNNAIVPSRTQAGSGQPMNTVNVAPMTPQQALAKGVRNYVYYDNLAQNLRRQANNATKLRDMYSEQVLNHMTQQNMEKAVIQVAGARLEIVDEKNSPSMSIQFLEQVLPLYFQQKGTQHDETQKIIQFIKNYKHTNTTFTKKLKKTLTGGKLPAPPENGPI